MSNVTLYALIIFLLPIAVLGQDGKVLPKKTIIAQSSEEPLVQESTVTESAEEQTDAEDMETESVETTTTTVTKKVQKPKPEPEPVVKTEPVVSQQGNNVSVTPAQGTPVHYGGDVYNFYFQKAPGPQTVIQGPGQTATAVPAPAVPVVEQPVTQVDDNEDEEEEEEEEVEAPPRPRVRAKYSAKSGDDKPKRRNFVFLGASRLRYENQLQPISRLRTYEAESEAFAIGYQHRLGKYWDLNLDYLMVGSSSNVDNYHAPLFESNIWQIYLGFSPIQIAMRDDMSLEFGLIGGIYRGAMMETNNADFPHYTNQSVLMWGPRMVFRLSERWALQLSGQINRTKGFDNVTAGFQFSI